MTNPPPRKRFQIHLSTAVVMMFAAGILMWANVQVRKTGFNDVNPSLITETWLKLLQEHHPSVFDARHSASDVRHIWALDREYGFPLRMTMRLSYRIEFSDESIVECNEDWRINRRALIANVVIGLGILLTIGLNCEWQIRRRAARKGA